MLEFVFNSHIIYNKIIVELLDGTDADAAFEIEDDH